MYRTHHFPLAELFYVAFESIIIKFRGVVQGTCYDTLHKDDSFFFQDVLFMLWYNFYRMHMKYESILSKVAEMFKLLIAKSKYRYYLN